MVPEDMPEGVNSGLRRSIRARLRCLRFGLRHPKTGGNDCLNFIGIVHVPSSEPDRLARGPMSNVNSVLFAEKSATRHRGQLTRYMLELVKRRLSNGHRG